MLEQIFLIVSDKFHNFATREDVITKSELYNLLDSESVIFPKKNIISLIPGQGFSEEDINNILKKSRTSKNSSHFDFSLWNNIPKRASKELTHKHNTENILISEPKRLTEDEFIMDVLIDENCEMMRDHQTGLHIQGMLLVEAARQAYLSTMEKFYIDGNEGKHYFIFNNLAINYNRFSFPLPSTIRLTAEKIHIANKKRTDTKVKIEILQCKEVSASVLMDVTVMPDNRVSNMENRLANQSLNEHFNHLTKKQEFNEAAHA